MNTKLIFRGCCDQGNSVQLDY